MEKQDSPFRNASPAFTREELHQEFESQIFQGHRSCWAPPRLAVLYAIVSQSACPNHTSSAGKEQLNHISQLTFSAGICPTAESLLEFKTRNTHSVSWILFLTEKNSIECWNPLMLAYTIVINSHPRLYYTAINIHSLLHPALIPSLSQT